MSGLRVVAVVSGHVQGVGSAPLQGPAPSLRGVGGSGVLRLSDGQVEVVLEGPEDDVRAVLAALDGPEAPGTVTGVVHRAEPAQGGSAFITE